MIVVRVELWPSGSERDQRVLGEATIENCGGSGECFRYRATISEDGDPVLGIPKRQQAVDVIDYDRRQSVWNLVHRVLSAANRSPGEQMQVAEPNDNLLGLFLDVLPAAWGLSVGQLEQLLGLPAGWLRAWRNHDVEIDEVLRSKILELGALQRRIRLLRTPDRYAGFWHHRWAAESVIGARSPWQAFVEDGPAALQAIRSYLDSGLQ